MIFNYTYRNGILLLNFIAEDNDILEYLDSKDNRIQLSLRTIEIYLPGNIPTPHNDVIAVSSYLLVFPFIGSRLTFTYPISSLLSDFFSRNFKLVVPGNIPTLLTKKTSPGLAFSGGYDSMASLLLLPANTKVFFLDRFELCDSPYKKDKVYLLLEDLKSSYDIYTIKTNLEKIRVPTGFVTDWASGIPAILLSDYLKLESVSYGFITHHISQLGNELPDICTGQNKYSLSDDALNMGSYKYWQQLFNCINLELSLPVIGMTEILTKNIVHKSPYYQNTSSCIRGDSTSDCQNCLKCFKHLLLEDLLYNNSINELNLSLILEKMAVLVKKQKHQCTLSSLDKIGSLEVFLLYFTHYYKGENIHLLQIRQNLSQYRKQVYYTTYWNTSTIHYIPKHYREQFSDKIKHYLNPTTIPPKSVTRITNYFDYTYIINLKRRPDRWKKMKRRMASLDLESSKWGRFEAINNKDPSLKKLFSRKKGWFESSGAFALVYSVIGVLLDALKKGYSKILILEDDVLFHQNFTELFNATIMEIPNDWKLLYLGTSCHVSRIKKRFKYFKNYVRSAGTIPGAFSIGLDRSIFTTLISILRQTCKPWDVGALKYINTQYHSHCYILYPYLTIADVTDSDLRNSKSMLEKAKKCQWKLENYLE